MSADDDPLLGVTVGSWRLTYLLGAGGMGRVYAAVQPEIGAKVAIKVLRRDSAADPEVVERFFNEARAVNLIRHENIVDVIDLGRLPDGSPYIVMEHLDGASLGALLRRERRLDLGTLGRVVEQVLSALEAAHAKGVIHRDLKPDNVFVSPSGHATVLDFGVAKLVRGDGLAATQTGNLLGTPAYMSPEQARTQPLDARSDLYAVGVILYEGATGRLPFTASNLFDLLDQQVRAAPPPPRAIDPAIPAALEAVILRALAKDPADRFASAAEMRASLAAALEGLPRPTKISVPPPADARSLATAETMDSGDPQQRVTQASLARGETMPSQPPAPRPVTFQIRKRTLVAILAGSGLVAAAGITLMVLFLTRRAPPAEAQVQVEYAGSADPRITIEQPIPPSPAIADASIAAPEAPPADARPLRPAADASLGRATADATIVHVDPGHTPAAHHGAAPPTPTARVGALVHFDPIARYPEIAASAEKEAGAKVMLHWLDFIHLAPNGQLAAGSEARYVFISPERQRRGDTCIVEVDVKLSGAEVLFEDVESSNPDKPPPCTGQIAAPRCSFAQLRDKAITMGLAPGSTDTVTLAHNSPYHWLWSAGDGEYEIEDACQ